MKWINLYRKRLAQHGTEHQYNTESALEVVSTARGHTAHLTHHSSNTQIAVAWVFHDSSDLTKTGMKEEEKKSKVKVAAGNDV